MPYSCTLLATDLSTLAERW